MDQSRQPPKRAVGSRDIFADLYRDEPTRDPQPADAATPGSHGFFDPPTSPRHSDPGSRESRREVLWRTPDPVDDSMPVFDDFSEPEPRPGRFGKSLGLTILSAFMPGLGLVGSRQRSLRTIGMLLALACVLVSALTLAFVATRVRPDEGESWLAAAATTVIGIAVGKGVLNTLSVLLLGLGVLWVALIVGTNLATRPRGLGRGKRAAAAAVVTVLSLGVSAPLAVGVNYAQALSATLQGTFAPGSEIVSDTKPTIDVGAENPFGNLERLNILLLGNDSDAGRIKHFGRKGFGVRTDTIMLASIDTRTGRTSLIQIPRNVPGTPFPRDSAMAKQFPRGFRGPGDPENWSINMIWEHIETDYPKLFEGQTFRGAEGLKQGVEGITGIRPHYFMMLNIDGLRELIDAMGGVRVNINRNIPIGSAKDGQYLKQGPNQHLDGYHAMWYGRSRSDSDDYDRMLRQSCLIKAMVEQANTTTILTRFEAILGASTDMVRTDIPREALQPLIDLGMKARQQPMERLSFIKGRNGYDPGKPDFEAMRRFAQEFVGQQPAQGNSSEEQKPPADPTTEPGSAPGTSAKPGSANKPAPSPSAPASSKAPDKPGQTKPHQGAGQPTPDNPAEEEGGEELGDACGYHPEPKKKR
ncbi:LCP family protein [Tessaracoccus sp. OH4464_COT-324]|uniref:LCP family protein n=1 Tax=Tessaracoccus sp. OH4464_COT-324 TaxID=2491059 RepID=UPI000F638F34|nr:LCP family protein [Tessaracoccus sp. OH4464_COT-324]RRD45688.1 LytR family transcriptional regulator [Tessaracoccus sp. OH4464_COT-324]